MKQFLIDTFDYNATNYTLRIFGNESNKTSLGCFIGLCSTLTILIISTFFLRDLFEGSQMTLISNFDGSTLAVNNISDSHFVLSITDRNGITLNTTGLLDLTLTYWKVYIGGMKNGVQTISYPLHPCQPDDMPAELWIPGHSELYMCLARGKYDMSIIGVYEKTINSGGYTMPTIFFSRCDPTKQQCLNETYIDEQLTSFFFTVMFSNYNIDNYNTTNPAVTNINYSYMSTLGSGMYKTYSLGLQQVLYDTDNGFVFQNHQVKQFYIEGSITPDFFLKSSFGPLTLGCLIVTNSSTIMKVYRCYMKTQTILAQIGGVINAIMIIGKFMQKFFIRRHNYMNLANLLLTSSREKMKLKD